jgi:hypothetical protein
MGKELNGLIGLIGLNGLKELNWLNWLIKLNRFEFGHCGFGRMWCQD